jgi:hypothetical protein
MKNLKGSLFLIAFVLLHYISWSQESLLYKNPNIAVDLRVKDLISRMSPEEKFWQLFMIPGNLEIKKEEFKNGIFGLQVNAIGNKNAVTQLLKYDASLPAHDTARTINSRPFNCVCDVSPIKHCNLMVKIVFIVVLTIWFNTIHQIEFGSGEFRSFISPK